MLAYPPPPKPEYQKPPPPLGTKPGVIPSSPMTFPPPLMQMKINSPPPGFVPPLPSVPHPDEIKKKSDEIETKGEKNKNNKDDSSDTSDDDNRVNNLGGERFDATNS